MTACRKISINKMMPTHSWKNHGRVGIIFFANKKDIYNTVVLSNVPCDGFYRCPPTSGSYVLHRFRVLSLPASLKPLRLASDRILGVSHTSGVTSALLFIVYSIGTQMAMAFRSNQSSSLPWSQPREIIFKHTTQQKLGTLQEFIIEDEYPAL